MPKGTPGAKKVKERSTVWYGQYKVNGKWKRVPLYTDKQASDVRLAELVKAEERGEVGLVNPHKESLERDIDEHVARLPDAPAHRRAPTPSTSPSGSGCCGPSSPTVNIKSAGRPDRRQDQRVHRQPAEEADEEQRRSRPGLGTDEGHLPRRRPRLRRVVHVEPGRNG